MIGPLVGSVAWLRKMRGRNQPVVDQAVMGNIRRLRWLLPVLLALDLLLLALFAFASETGAADQATL